MRRRRDFWESSSLAPGHVLSRPTAFKLSAYTSLTYLQLKILCIRVCGGSLGDLAGQWRSETNLCELACPFTVWVVGMGVRPAASAFICEPSC